VDQIVYLNGEYVPLADAKIPVLDRGFIFGDGVYEVIPAYRRVLFRLEEHLARQRAQPALDPRRDLDPAEHGRCSRRSWRAPGTIRASTCQVRAASRRARRSSRRARCAHGVRHVGPLRCRRPSSAASGVAVVTRDDYRWRRCDIKSVSLLANCLLRQEAEDAGAVETVLIRDGNVKEASTCNVFLVKDGVILAPPKDNLILHGITFDLALVLARDRAARR
jgi:D-alanine transaminase